MYGAFIGDIVGSKYEFNNIKTKEFPLFSPDCAYTDDSVMTAAVAKAIMLYEEGKCDNETGTKDIEAYFVEAMQDFGRRYPYPKGAYGGRFAAWLRSDNPAPYGSYGNGSAMRVSPCGLAAVTIEEAKELARASAAVTHNHPEGIKGAEAVAAAIFMAKTGSTKEEIRKYTEDNYYKLDFTLDSIRASYSFDESCQGTVPEAIEAFLESESFEDAIRNVISIGGDSDTTGAITGSIAWAYYSNPARCHGEDEKELGRIKEKAAEFLPEEFKKIAEDFRMFCQKRARA
jgi:ADP-ribosylglycohydrolase